MPAHPRHAEASDRELLRAAAAGDGDSFGEFYRRHRRVVLGYFVNRTRNPEVAADLLAETFASALSAVAGRDSVTITVPLAWLMTIARNKLVDSLRRGRVEDAARRALSLEPIHYDDQDLARIEDIASSVDFVAELERELPPEQFAALRDRIIEEREYDEVAAGLDCSPMVVRKRVSRALTTLRARLGGAGEKGTGEKGTGESRSGPGSGGGR